MERLVKGNRRYSYVLGIGLLVLVVALLVGCEKKQKVEVPEPGTEGYEKVKTNSHEKNFALISPNHPVYVGEKNTIVLEIESRNGLKINSEFPWKVKIKQQDDLHLTARELSPKEIEMGDKKVRMTFDVEPKDAGTFDIEGSGTFSVCSTTLCDVRRDEPLLFTVVAEPKMS